MSTSVWRGPEPNPNDIYPLGLLKYLLKHMLLQFGAQGGCMALYDESSGQMRVHTHLRVLPQSGDAKPTRRVTIKLLPETVPGGSAGRKRPTAAEEEEVVDVTPQQSDLFPVDKTYAIGQDLIGYTWQTNELHIMRLEEYIALFHTNHSASFFSDGPPQVYLAVPIREAVPGYELYNRQPASGILGVVVLYHFNNVANALQKQRADALTYTERVALYLQNCRLQQAQRRTSEYLQLLQNISNTFPTSVKLSDLVENVYQFAIRVVDVSSLLLTLYDRDLDRLYDVFAVRDGVRIEGIVENPHIMRKEDRPVWWNTTQQERRTLLFSPAQEPQKAYEYRELLTGIWGDQQHTESFLLLPMKMFHRVIGSLCLTSMKPHAYHAEEIQVLETMAQIVTVGIENAKLYERDRRILHEANQREAHLAAINSTLQSISSVLNVTELLQNLVESVATLVNVSICAFFQPSPNQEELVALAVYGPSSVRMVDDGSGLPEPPLTRKAEHDQLIHMIRLPFKGTFLEHMVNEGFFYLDPPKIEEIAQQCNEGGAIFLHEANVRYMLMVPMSYQKEFIGFLAVPVPHDGQLLRPKDVGTLLAICAQASSAIRNAQLFEQRTEAYAELERMDRLKDEFLVTASHELRTPLTAISGYSSQLKRQGARANPQTILRFANKIYVAAQQLSNLVANMTEAAQIGAVDKKLSIEPVQLLAAAEMAVNVLTLSSEQNVTLDIAPTVWVSGDAVRLRQVLSNLLENASKYSPPDSPISVSASVMPLSEIEGLLSADQADPTLLLEHEDSSMVLVRVKDQGEGVLPEDRERIFEKFVRAPRSLTTPVRGSGLGLYICRRFVEAMNGKLWLEESASGEGSTFSFYLPRLDPPVEFTEM